MATVQVLLEVGDPQTITAALKGTVAGYNRDDCLSARALRDWLEGVRSTLIATGAVIERPIPPTGEVSEVRGVWQARVAEFIRRLTPDVPADARERTADQHAR